MKDNKYIITELREIVKDFPLLPGVYIMRNRENEVVYVGKAKKLKNRVLSYFNKGKDLKTSLLMTKAHSIEYILTDSEYEALLLENNLIKKWRPRYNINLKDGKSYPVIALTREEYPVVYKTRNIDKRKKITYYGPFPDVKAIDIYLDLIEKLFPLRKCRGRLKKLDKPCLNYHIKKCGGVCAGKETKEEYSAKVTKVKQLLSGKTSEIIKDLEEKMLLYSTSLEFEKAAKIRDSINALKQLKEGQKIVDFNYSVRDYIGIYSSSSRFTFVVMKMREGQMLDKAIYHCEFPDSDEEALVQFLFQYYTEKDFIPQGIYLPLKVRDEELEALLQEKKEKRVYIHHPEKGHQVSVIKMANENARMEFHKKIRKEGDFEGLTALKEALGLDVLPKRIEGFDIAQLDGHFTVASLVSFFNGVPDKKNYKRFKMKSLGGQIDDFKSISEAVARRYTRVLNENLEQPDLILIDGGKGQVSAAQSVLEALGLEIPLAGLAKKFEHIFRPYESDPIILPHGSPGLRVLQGVRDETHRFATDYNKNLRKKRLVLSSLESVPGIGQVKAKKLLTTFGSVDNIAKSTPEEISEKTGINRELSETVCEYLKKKES